MDKQQIRKESIQTLYEYFENREGVKLIDPILFKARSLWPELREPTLREYAVTVLGMLERKRVEVKADGNSVQPDSQ